MLLWGAKLGKIARAPDGSLGSSMVESLVKLFFAKLRRSGSRFFSQVQLQVRVVRNSVSVWVRQLRGLGATPRRRLWMTRASVAD